MTRIENEWRYFDKSLGMNAPWYTSTCLEWLNTIDLKGRRIFEYGVGESTLWYRAKGADVMGVDNSEPYAKAFGVHYHQFCGDYARASYRFIDKGTRRTQYDIIIIDGICRDQCTEYALKALRPKGFLIIDNYKQKTADLEHWPLTEKLIEGMDVKYFKEPGHEDWLSIVVTK